MFKKVYVEIGNLCNLHCQFCSLNHRKSHLMKASEFQKIAPEIKKFSDYIYLHVKGEPLIHPELEEILKICEEVKLKVNITTNGTLLLEKLEILKKNDCIRQVNISAHAFSEIPNFNKIKYLEGLRQIVDFVKETKKFYLSIRFWIENKEVKNEVASYLEENCGIILGDTDGKVYENIYSSYDEEFVWPSLDHEFIGETGRCLGTKDQIAILANGDVVPCCLDCNGVIVFGNCFEEKLENILKSGRFMNMRKEFGNNKVIEELCKRCSYRLKFK